MLLLYVFLLSLTASLSGAINKLTRCYFVSARRITSDAAIYVNGPREWLYWRKSTPPRLYADATAPWSRGLPMRECMHDWRALIAQIGCTWMGICDSGGARRTSKRHTLACSASETFGLESGYGPFV